MKITKARITEMPEKITDPIPKVIVTVESGEEMELFTFFPDEVSFSENEFVGLTVKQAYELKYNKDLQYLSS